MLGPASKESPAVAVEAEGAEETEESMEWIRRLNMAKSQWVSPVVSCDGSNKSGMDLFWGPNLVK